jgi:hypothetical protein
MNCEQHQLELEDLLYGELDDSRANTLRAHLRTCAACAARQVELEREHEIFTQYYEQTAPEPSDALWRGIQTRIQAEGRAVVAEPPASWWQRLFANPAWWQQTAFAAALVLVSVTVTTFYFKWQAQPVREDFVVKATPTPQPSPTTTPETSAPAPKIITPSLEKRFATQPAPKPLKLTEEQTLQNQLARAEREYQQAIKLLDRVVARRRDQLEPAVWQQYQSSLALIDNSIAESRRALRGETTDAAASQFLLAAYARKLDLMRDLAMQAGQ